VDSSSNFCKILYILKLQLGGLYQRTAVGAALKTPRLFSRTHKTEHVESVVTHVKQKLFKDIQSVADKNTVIFVLLGFIGWDTPIKNFFAKYKKAPYA
jgi:hypothetical protein